MKHISHSVWVLVRTAIGIGLLVFLGISGAMKWSALFGLWSAWPITLAALIVLILNAVCMSLRLSLLCRPHGFHLPFRAAMRLTLIGIFFNSCLPGSTGGDVVKIYYAAEGNRGKRTEIATVLLFDRAVGMFGLLVWPLLLCPFFLPMIGASPALSGLLRTVALFTMAMLAGFLACFSSRIRNSRFVQWLLAKEPGGNYARRILDTVHSYRYSAGYLTLAFGISLLSHLLATGATLLGAWAIDARAAAWGMSLLIPLGFLANTLPLTPGGLGVGEAAFEALFGMVGFKGGAEALLGWRLLTFLIGLSGLVLYAQGRKRMLRSATVVPTLESES